jgi:hypothetical protein
VNDSDDGSSLIWFVSLLAVVLMVLLVLASSIHQYLFARSLTDYVEQLAVAGKTLINQDVSFADLEKRMQQLPHFPQPLTNYSMSYQDGKTLEVRACSKWVSPIPLVSVSRVVCEKALAR